MSLNFHKIMVTQCRLRRPEQLDGMIDYVKNGGRWQGILLCGFMDRFFLDDGHHRTVATLLSGRDFFYDEEYVIGKWTYEDYLHLNIEKGWLTPFDPLHETRLPDLAEYKKKVAAKEIDFPTYSERDHPGSFTNFIKTTKFKNLYCEPRQFFGVDELAVSYDGSKVNFVSAEPIY
jgi:hypothetical protein